MTDIEHGILYECFNDIVGNAAGVFDSDKWHRPKMPGIVFSPSESFTSYAFWLGRDSDELIELVD